MWLVSLSAFSLLVYNFDLISWMLWNETLVVASQIRLNRFVSNMKERNNIGVFSTWDGILDPYAEFIFGSIYIYLHFHSFPALRWHCKLRSSRMVDDDHLSHITNNMVADDLAILLKQELSFIGICWWLWSYSRNIICRFRPLRFTLIHRLLHAAYKVASILIQIYCDEMLRRITANKVLWFRTQPEVVAFRAWFDISSFLIVLLL